MFRPIPTLPVMFAVTLLAGVPSIGLAQGPGNARGAARTATKAGTAQGPKDAKSTDVTALVGAWSGTATIPLGDSTIVVPVTYNFSQTNGVLAGIAMVPGQGSGPIGKVVKDGDRIRFVVTAPENRLLEHDGTLSASRVIEGMVHLDNKPIAKFRITPAKPGAAPR